MSGAACDEARAAAPELALGMLDGEERARVLAHARGCPACRAHLDELAVVAQELLTAAPAHEPPPGFESRVLDALARRTARRARPRPPVGAGDRGRRVLLAGGGATAITLSQTRDERRLGTYYREVLARAGGKYLAARELRDAAGAKRGVVFLYQGDQPWVTVVLAAGAADGPGALGSRRATARRASWAASTPRRPARSGVTRCRVGAPAGRCAPDRRRRPRAARAAAAR